MALPLATVCKVMHCPLYELQLVRRGEVAAAAYVCPVIVACWKKLRRPLEDLKDLDKMSTAAIDLAPFPDDLWHAAWWKRLRRPLEDLEDLDKLGIASIHLSPPPVDAVDKVVREPLKALNQLDKAADDFILEADPADVPFSPNSPSTTGCHKLPPLRFPPSIQQLRIVYNTTTNNEGQGNNKMGVQGERADADGVQEGGGGFGIQVDLASIHLFLTKVISGMCRVPWNQGQVQSLSLVSDFGCVTVEFDMEVGDTSSSLTTVDLGDGVAVQGMLEDVGDFEAVAAGFFVQAPSPSSLVSDQDALGVEVQPE